MALAGMARCAMEGKNYATAKNAAQAIIRAAARAQVPDSVLGVAYAVTGEIALRPLTSIAPKALSEDKEKLGQVMDGLEQLLRPIVQYKGSEWAEQRCLYHDNVSAVSSVFLDRGFYIIENKRVRYSVYSGSGIGI